MESTGVHEFSLTGADGKSHAYVVTEHPAGEGMAIMYDLLALGAPSLLTLAGAALKSEDLVRAVLSALGDGSAEIGAAEFGTMVSELDLAGAAAEVGRALGTGRAPDLTRKVLARTFRDGQPLTRAFDLAYQANYQELLMAVWKVCQINRFFPVPDTSPAPSAGPSRTIAPPAD